MTGCVVMTRGDNMKNEYSGSWVNWSWIRFRMLMTVADEQDTIRAIIVQWKSTIQASLSPGLILDLTNSVEPVLAPYNYANRNLFTVLYDQTQTLVNTAETSEVALKAFIPGNRLKKTYFNRTTDQVLDGGIYIVLVSNSLAPPSPPVDWTMEGYFTDDI